MTIAKVLVLFALAACGGKAQPAPAATSQEPAPMPTAPEHCCCELPDARGTQLATEAECTGQQGTCTPITQCRTGGDEPAPAN